MELHDYIRIFFRRKWVIIFSFLSVFFGAGVYALKTPAMYKSTTTILIIPQLVPENYVRSTVTLNMEDRLPTIQQQITSRTRLINVMDELGLFREERKEQVLDDIVDMMKQQVEIDVAQDRRKAIVRDADVFSISFSYQDPKLAMLTASRLASTFIDENLKSRERQAVGTSKLLGSQLKETKAKLEAQEEKVRQYKVRYLGELPQELQSNLSSLSRLEQQYNSNVSEIRDAESRKLQLQSQLSVISRGPQTIVHGDGKTEIDASQDAAQALITQLTLRRNLLDEVSAKYTERHPDVIRLRHEVEELEKKLREAPVSVHSGNGTGKNVTSSPVYLPVTEKERAEFRRLKQQIASIEGEIVALRAEKANIQRRLRKK